MTATYLDSCMVIGLIEGDTEQRKALKNYLAYQACVQFGISQAGSPNLGYSTKK